MSFLMGPVFVSGSTISREGRDRARKLHSLDKHRQMAAMRMRQPRGENRKSKTGWKARPCRMEARKRLSVPPLPLCIQLPRFSRTDLLLVELAPSRRSQSSERRLPPPTSLDVIDLYGAVDRAAKRLQINQLVMQANARGLSSLTS